MRKRSDTERYLVRIYRRDPKDPKRIRGVVEGVEGKGKVGFLGPDALWKILASAGHPPPQIGETGKKGEQDGGFQSFTEIMESIGNGMEEDPGQ